MTVDSAGNNWHHPRSETALGTEVGLAQVRKGRHMADLTDAGDELVVFLIGMRANKPWKVAQWWPVFTAMPTMLRYLQQHPEKGLLGYLQTLLPRTLRPRPRRSASGGVAALQPAGLR